MQSGGDGWVNVVGQDVCLRVLDKALRKSIKMLLDAVDRTPPIISSRPIIEEVLDLLTGAYTVLMLLKKGECKQLAYVEVRAESSS